MQMNSRAALKTLLFLLPLPIFTGLLLLLDAKFALSGALVASLAFAIWSKSFYRMIDRLTWVSLAVLLVCAFLSSTGSLSSDITVLTILVYAILAFRPIFAFRAV